MQPILLVLVLGFLASGLPAFAQDKESFFEFSISQGGNKTFAQLSDEVIIFEGPEADSGGYRIRGDIVEHYAGNAVTQLPKLPATLEKPGAAILDEKLFVAGRDRLFYLDLSNTASGWSDAGELPSLSSDSPLLATLSGTLYLAGAGESGDALYQYDHTRGKTRGRWTMRTSSPENLQGFVGTSCGIDHLLFFDGTQSSDQIIAYHRVTDRWFEYGRLPEAVQTVGVFSDDLDFTLFTSDALIKGKGVLRSTKYGWIDHLVVAALVLLLIGSGFYFGRKEKSSGDYFRGGQRIPWWAAGLSLFATGASAISLMAMPGKSFAENWIYFSFSIFTVLIQIPLFLLVYIPLARRLKISTANEYLERRFSLSIRLLGFTCFSLNQTLGRIASILLLPSLAISAISGMPMMYSILIMGLVTTLFVTMGGLEAVIWTDVIQALIMLFAVLGCALFAFFSLELDWPAAMEVLSNGNKLQVFDWRVDWREPVAMLVFLNTFCFVLGWIGDQNFIQRVQCTKDEAESRQAIYTQLAVAVPLNLILFGLGTLLFLFYLTRPEEMSPALKPDGVFPFFAAENLPSGMAGFVVVALLASTISTVSSAMNSVANLGVEDVYRRFVPHATDQSCLKIGRFLTLGLGLFGTGAALLLASMSSLKSIWDLFISINGMVLAPITGIFVLGIFSRRANSFGAWAGCAASVAANYYATFHMDVSPLVYLIVGVFSCIIVGYIASVLSPRDPRALDGLTAFSLLKRAD